ncbi:kinectin [Trichonephila clavipes]|nr:kinectin [Trichonephila clavipes]
MKNRHDFHEGDRVWLWNPKRRKGLSPKLQTNWEGPYTVLKRLNDVVVQIQNLPQPNPKIPPPVSRRAAVAQWLGIQPWQACHEFDPSTTKDPPCRAAMHVKSVES